jgi:hypothetical protein
MDKSMTAPLNAADFNAIERAAVSYLYSVALGSARFEDGRYRSCLTLLGYLDKHYGKNQAHQGPATIPAAGTTDPRVLYNKEVEESAPGSPDAGQPDLPVL